MASARSILRSHSRRDEHRCTGTDDIGRVPHAARIDRVLAGAERGLLHAVGQFLHQGDLARGADHHLVAVGMPLPTRPALVECVHRDQPALRAVGGVALGIGAVPVDAGELGLRRGAGAEAEMERETFQDVLRHDGTSIAGRDVGAGWWDTNL